MSRFNNIVSMFFLSALVVSCINKSTSVQNEIIAKPYNAVKVEFYDECSEKYLENVKLYKKKFVGYEAQEYLYYNFSNSERVEPMVGFSNFYSLDSLRTYRTYYLCIKGNNLNQLNLGIDYMPIRVEKINRDTIIKLNRIGEITIDSNSFLTFISQYDTWEMYVQDAERSTHHVLTEIGGYSTGNLVFDSKSQFELFIYKKQKSSKNYHHKDIIYKRVLKDLKCKNNIVYID